MKNLIMTVVTVSALTMATTPVFALKDPVSASKMPAATSLKTKSGKISKQGLKNKEALTGVKKAK
jgi:hypothetical protein